MSTTSGCGDRENGAVAEPSILPSGPLTVALQRPAHPAGTVTGTKGPVPTPDVAESKSETC